MLSRVLLPLGETDIFLTSRSLIFTCCLGRIWDSSRYETNLAEWEKKLLQPLSIRKTCVIWYEGKGVRGEVPTINQEYYAWILCYMQEKGVRRIPGRCSGFRGLGKVSTSRELSTTILQQNCSHWQPWMWLNPWWHVCLSFNFSTHLFLLMILSISIGKTVTFLIIGFCYSSQSKKKNI